jgi:protein-S-isoprenylcysteine O-methyltransferase Ste14
MAKRGSRSKHRIVRNAIKEDLFYFGVPAILVYLAGLLISAKGGWVELPATIWKLIRHPENISTLSVSNIVGIVLVLIGFAILLVAQITLGRYHASVLVIWENHQLIRHGIYRYIRHPLYLGVLIACIGLAVYGSSLPGILTMSALIPIFLFRIRIEERMLIEEFGGA